MIHWVKSHLSSVWSALSIRAEFSVQPLESPSNCLQQTWLMSERKIYEVFRFLGGWKDGAKRHGTEWMKTLVQTILVLKFVQNRCFLLLDFVSHIHVSGDCLNNRYIEHHKRCFNIYSILSEKHKHIKGNSDDVRLHPQQNTVLSACSSCAWVGKILFASYYWPIFPSSAMLRKSEPKTFFLWGCL